MNRVCPLIKTPPPLDSILSKYSPWILNIIVVPYPIPWYLHHNLSSLFSLTLLSVIAITLTLFSSKNTISSLCLYTLLSPLTFHAINIHPVCCYGTCVLLSPLLSLLPWRISPIVGYLPSSSVLTLFFVLISSHLFIRMVVFCCWFLFGCVPPLFLHVLVLMHLLTCSVHGLPFLLDFVPHLLLMSLLIPPFFFMCLNTIMPNNTTCWLPVVLHLRLLPTTIFGLKNLYTSW